MENKETKNDVKTVEVKRHIEEFFFPGGTEYLPMTVIAGSLEEATKAYEKVSALDPLHPDIWLDLSDVYVEAGEMKKAFDVIEEGVYQQPKNASLLYRLAGLLMKEGKSKQGFAVLSEALEMEYDKNKELFEFFPALELNIEVQELIQSYFKKK